MQLPFWRTERVHRANSCKNQDKRDHVQRAHDREYDAITKSVIEQVADDRLNLEPGDLPGCADSYYRMELIRAVTLTWLFSGLRSDEIARLRVGCVRWQHDGQPIPGDSADVLADDAARNARRTIA